MLQPKIAAILNEILLNHATDKLKDLHIHFDHAIYATNSVELSQARNLAFDVSYHLRRVLDTYDDMLIKTTITERE